MTTNSNIKKEIKDKGNKVKEYSNYCADLKKDYEKKHG